MNDLKIKDNATKDWRKKPIAIFCLCIIGIILDMAGKQIAVKMNVPLYLDSVGYIGTAMVGAYLPGIVVGYFSNLFTGLQDITNAYYGIISVLIAVCIGYMAEKGYFKKVWGFFAGILVAALIGGGIGGILTWLLFGFDPNTPVTFSFIQRMMENGSLSVFSANMLSSLLLDLIDKAISFTITIGLVQLVPKEWKDRFSLHHLQNLNLSNEERKAARRKYSRRMSLRAKVVLLVGLTMVCIATVAGVICFMLYDRSTLEEHTSMARGAANLVGGIIDPDKVDEYLEKGESADDYLNVENMLISVKESSPDIQYVYVYKYMPDGVHVVFDIDTPTVPGVDPGEVIEVEEAFRDDFAALLNGEEIAPVVADTDLGWLLMVYEPLRDSAGNTVCYVGVDISMDQVKLNERSFITKEIALFMGFIIMVLAFTLWIAEYNLLAPVNAMALAADRFVYDNEENLELGVERMKKLEVETGDEIEHLYHAFTKTIEETVGYISEVNKKNEMITKMQNNLILVLADMVESRDESTGDHIKKTAAYVELLCRKMQEKPEYKDIYTEEFIDNCVHSAPLHDVGKISISDTILNKPGRLTDEEFEIMKTHTTAGEEIISHVIETVTESGYLTEAKNMAAYHHEKWNGSGYPYGKKGEDIPLSARIMAIADVFDALVSRRCYKEPFSFEKAMSIIVEDAGKHFDPVLAEVFKNAEDEVRAIAEEKMGGSLIHHEDSGQNEK